MKEEEHNKKKLRRDITVMVPRKLWRRVKYEAWRRQITAKSLIIDALESALARWGVR